MFGILEKHDLAGILEKEMKGGDVAIEAAHARPKPSCAPPPPIIAGTGLCVKTAATPPKVNEIVEQRGSHYQRRLQHSMMILTPEEQRKAKSGAIRRLRAIRDKKNLREQQRKERRAAEKAPGG